MCQHSGKDLANNRFYPGRSSSPPIQVRSHSGNWKQTREIRQSERCKFGNVSWPWHTHWYPLCMNHGHRGCCHIHLPGSNSMGVWTPQDTGSEIHSLHQHMFHHSYKGWRRIHLFPHCISDLVEQKRVYQYDQSHNRGLFLPSAMCALSWRYTSKARLADTIVAVDAIFADAIITGITGTVVKVNLTVCTWSEKTSRLHFCSKHFWIYSAGWQK